MVVDAFLATNAKPKYYWFRRSAPGVPFTFLLACILLVITLILYNKRVQKLKRKFGPEAFTGSLRVSALISAYMDNHEEPKFAIFRLCTINLIFLGFLQMNYQLGFLVMLGFLVVESSLDTIRVWLAYRNCRSLRSLSVISDDEAYVLQEATKLEPTNVYEDLTRPRAIAFMVFLVQALLIGLVIDDSYHSTTRTCFDGSGASCLMFTSLGTK